MAATVHSATRSHNIYNSPVPSSPLLPSQRSPNSKQRFLAEFSQCLVDFVIQLLPTVEELAVKEDVRKLLERLIRTIEPDSRLLSFGSTANGFSLRNSDMDLCCLIDSGERLSASDLVNMLGDLLERETKFHVKPLPHARIPIVKLNLDPSPGLPFGIACDIGFENRLALENTRLLMCYAMIDPARVRTMVLFLKVWSKRRKINSPYQGTLSSYGYVLLVIYFLVHVKNPPVLPNLQQMPPMRPISKEDMYLNGHNIWFFDDIELLRQRWQSSNTETVAELLIDFFKYFSRDFSYNTTVVSIRAGLLKKDSKGWLSESDIGTPRERNRFCIEDPFELEFNVSRCVTKEGLFMIRGEFMRAARVLQSRPDRAIVALAQLCEERKEEEPARGATVPAAVAPFVPPRLSPVSPQVPTSFPANKSPAQTPYPVGSSPIRTTADIPLPVPRLQPSPVTIERPISRIQPVQVTQPRISTPPQHMAPKRGKWTSPPPLEAPIADRSAFEDQFGRNLAMATTSLPGAPRRDSFYASSSNNSDVLTDDERSEADVASSSTSSSPQFVSQPPKQFDAYSVHLANLPPPKPARVAPSRIDMVQRPTPSTIKSSPFSSSSIPFGYAASYWTQQYHHQQLSGLRHSPQPTVFYETGGEQPAVTASLPQHVLMARKRNMRKGADTGSNTPTSSQQLPHDVIKARTSTSSMNQQFSSSSNSLLPSTSINSVRNNQSSVTSGSIPSSASNSPRSRSPAKRSQQATLPNTRSPQRRNDPQAQLQDTTLTDDFAPDLTFSSSSPPTSCSGGSLSGGSPDSSGSSPRTRGGGGVRVGASPLMGTQGRASPLMLAAMQQQQQQKVEFRRGGGMAGFGRRDRDREAQLGFR